MFHTHTKQRLKLWFDLRFGVFGFHRRLWECAEFWTEWQHTLSEQKLRLTSSRMQFCSVKVLPVHDLPQLALTRDHTNGHIRFLLYYSRIQPIAGDIEKAQSRVLSERW
jgi:hypothetical protein